MGDEQGAICFDSSGLEGGIGNGDAHEIVEAGVVDLESEERGDGFAELMPEVFGWKTGAFAADASGGDEERFALVKFAVRRFDFEALVDLAHVCRAAVSSPSRSRVTSGVGQAINDRF